VTVILAVVVRRVVGDRSRVAWGVVVVGARHDAVIVAEPWRLPHSFPIATARA
jgi:hypothetical protein